MRRLAVLLPIGILAAGAAALFVSTACADAPVEDQATFKNVKILTNVTSKTEMRRIMKEQAAALGVKCSHCHVPGKFELDDKEEKRRAREMMEMVKKLEETTFKDEEKKPSVTCWTCHRGKTEPETVVPPEAFAATDEQK